MGELQQQLHRLARDQRSLAVADSLSDVAVYFGAGSARGFLVVQADAAWDPIRTGDVVLRVLTVTLRGRAGT